MTADEAVVAVIDALQQADICYMVVGSLASNLHGIPRSTRDADFVIDVDAGALQRLENGLPPELQLQPQGSFEPVTGTTRHVIELSGSPFVAELFVCGDDPHDRERLARRARVRLFDESAYVATVEDMIITKLRWARDAHRAKDLDDARNMIAVRGDDLDWTYVTKWCAIHGTDRLLRELRESIPPME